jgi:hypothetical protein
MPSQTNPPVDKQRTIPAVAARLFWMAIGNFTLMICAAHIIMGESVSTRTSDIIFWCVVAAMIIVRFLDIKFLDGLTVTDKPATLAHWRKYAFILIICSGIIWAAAHAAVSLFKS